MPCVIDITITPQIISIAITLIYSVLYLAPCMGNALGKIPDVIFSLLPHLMKFIIFAPIKTKLYSKGFKKFPIFSYEIRGFREINVFQRMERYLTACAGDTRKAMTLYRYNL